MTIDDIKVGESKKIRDRLSFQVPPDLIDALDGEAESQKALTGYNITRSDIARKILCDIFEIVEKKKTDE